MMISHGVSQKYNDALRKLPIYDYLCFPKEKPKVSINYKKAKHLFKFLIPLKIIFRILGIERLLSMIKNMSSANSQVFNCALH